MAGRDRRQRLASDVTRTRGLMIAVIGDARRLDVEVPEAITVSVIAWRSWGDQLQAWADEHEEN